MKGVGIQHSRPIQYVSGESPSVYTLHVYLESAHPSPSKYRWQSLHPPPITVQVAESTYRYLTVQVAESTHPSHNSAGGRVYTPLP